MRTTYLLIIVISFAAFSCSSENPHCYSYKSYMKSVMDGKFYFKCGDFKLASIYLQEAIDLKPYENVSDYLYLASSAFHLGENELAKDALKKSIILNNCDKDYFKSFDELVQYHFTKEFQSVLFKFNIYAKQYENNLKEKEFITKLDSLILVDQDVRSTRDLDIISYSDSLNMVELKRLTQKYGWHDKGWLLLWHQRASFPDGPFWDYFIPLIDNEIANCNVHPKFWSIFIDYKSMRLSSSQIYGHFPDSFTEYPVQNVINIDSIRSTVCLQPLWFMKKVYDWPLPKGYIIPLRSVSSQ